MTYQRTTIYWMSGTGNSLRAAHWLGDRAGAAEVEANLVQAVHGDPEREVEPSDKQLVGLVFPTHGFTAPWRMIKFAWRMPRDKGAHAFCVATRGGTKFGPVKLPGIAASACFLLALILRLRGYRVRGVMSLNMPSNWMSLHWGLLLPWLVSQSSLVAGVDNTLARWAVMTLWTFPCVLIGYRLISRLLVFKPVNHLFTYTTLTHWYRRYHEPESKLKELVARPKQP